MTGNAGAIEESDGQGHHEEDCRYRSHLCPGQQPDHAEKKQCEWRVNSQIERCRRGEAPDGFVAAQLRRQRTDTSRELIHANAEQAPENLVREFQVHALDRAFENGRTGHLDNEFEHGSDENARGENDQRGHTLRWNDAVVHLHAVEGSRQREHIGQQGSKRGLDEDAFAGQQCGPEHRRRTGGILVLPGRGTNGGIEPAFGQVVELLASRRAFHEPVAFRRPGIDEPTSNAGEQRHHGQGISGRCRAPLRRIQAHGFKKRFQRMQQPLKVLVAPRGLKRFRRDLTLHGIYFSP